jgi:multimeric flavodoxin WrbA
VKITVLNGSPKGATSVTMQYVRFVQEAFPQHELNIVHVALKIKSIERDEEAFQEIVDSVRASDGVLWAFPLYIQHVHANYKRFIELIWERGVEDAFRDKYAASLSTSIHFFDHTAHNYVHAINDDLGMRYVGAFSAEMRDLLQEGGPARLDLFARSFFAAIENRAPTQRRYAPLVHSEFDYVPGPAPDPIPSNGQKIVVLTDAEPHQANLRHLIQRFCDSLSGQVEIINLHDLDIKGSCLGCLRCGYNHQCAYTGKDGFIDFYNARLKTTDILVFAGAIRDRYLSSTWKTFFDRSFFNTHTPSLVGKQFAFIVSGPLGQNANLREILEAWVQFQQSHLVGFVTDEEGDSAGLDDLLRTLAANLVWCAETGYMAPPTFLGVAGMKVFRDDIWGRLRTVFRADHRAYKEMGIYDFPQRNWGVCLLNGVTAVLFKMPRFREEFARRIKRQMVQPYQKALPSPPPVEPARCDPEPGARRASEALSST